MIVLTKEELGELTGKERPSAQVRALGRMGIPHRTRPDGSPVVLRVHLEMTEAAYYEGGSDRGDGRLLVPRREPQLQP
jgi:hypothetical protein